MGVTDESKHPGVPRLKEIVREAVEVETPLPEGAEIYVYTFGDDAGPEHVRVAEVGAGTPTGGFAWMRVEDTAANIILSCEDFLLTWDCDATSIMVYDGYVGGKYDPSIYDPEQESIQRLRYAIGGQDAQKPWEHRFPPDFRLDDPDVEWYDPEKQAAYEANLGAGA